MQEQSNEPPPHPFDLDVDDTAVHYGPGVHLGPPDQDRAVRLDQLDPPAEDPDERDERDEDAGDPDERRPAVTARRPRRPTGGKHTATRHTGRAGKTSPRRGRSTGRARTAGELALGAAIFALAMAFGAYWLTSGPLGLGTRASLVLAGYMGGISSGGVIYPLWRAGRTALARYITPKVAR